jgi:hypothetical protein
MLNNPRTLLTAGVAVGGALAWGIYRRYRATFATNTDQPGERFYSLHGIRVTAGAEAPLDYTDIDGIKLTRIGPKRL